MTMSKSSYSDRLGPYLRWLLSDKSRYRENLSHLPVIIKLKDKTFSQVNFDVWEQIGLTVSPIYREPINGPIYTHFVTGVMSPEFVEKLKQFGEHQLPEQIEHLEFGGPAPTFGGDNRVNIFEPEATDGTPFEQYKGRTLAPIVAVIDDSLAFLNRRFRDGLSSTRIAYLWDQEFPWSNDSEDQDHRIGSIMGYGSEFTAETINQLIETGLPELSAYQRVAHPGMKLRWGHGTHVMDVACGEEPADLDQSVYRPIIGVQIQPPDTRVRDTSGLWMSVRILDALHYILRRATDLARHFGTATPPVVVNLSNGNVAGPHDGDSLLESAMDELISQYNVQHPLAPVAMMIAAGNHRQARCHGQWKLAPGQEETALWRILPDDETPSFMEIWCRHSQADPLQVRVTPPGGQESAPISPGDPPYQWTNGGDDALCTVVYPDPDSTEAGYRIKVLIAVEATTASGDGNPHTAPCGVWTIRLTNTGQSSLAVDAWLQRDDSPGGFRRRGRQSYFEDPHYPREDFEDPRYLPKDFKANTEKSSIKRAGTLNAIASGTQTIAVGAYRYNDGKIVTYSAEGRDENGFPSIKFPTFVSVSDDSKTRYGVVAAGNHTGSRLAMNGTSVAVAVATRRLAQRLAKELAEVTPCQQTQLNPEKLLAAIIEGEKSVSEQPGAGRHPYKDLEDSSTRLGAGRLLTFMDQPTPTGSKPRRPRRHPYHIAR